jgi:hypothetical protein
MLSYVVDSVEAKIDGITTYQGETLFSIKLKPTKYDSMAFKFSCKIKDMHFIF